MRSGKEHGIYRQTSRGTVGAILLCSILAVSFTGVGENDGLIPQYLQAVTASGITVMVESRTGDPVYVECGLTTRYGYRTGSSIVDKTTRPTYMHKIRLTGLAPNAVYHYRVFRGRDTTDDATFMTASIDGAALRFAWMADFRTGSDVFDTISTRVLASSPRFALYGGDLCWSGAYRSFRNEFFRPAHMALIRHVPFFNSVGNHEGWRTNMKAFSDAPVSLSGTGDYYSFDYGPVHVLVLNTEVDHFQGSAQWQFADSDLASTRRPWKIVISHEAGYAPGGHENNTMLAMSALVFAPRKVDLCLAGHSHFYQHNLVDGIHQCVVGSAGAPLIAPKKGEWTIAMAREHNYAIVDVDSVRLSMMVYNERGMVLDSLVLRKTE